jgi:hypothetical protein
VCLDCDAAALVGVAHGGAVKGIEENLVRRRPASVSGTGVRRPTT